MNKSKKATPTDTGQSAKTPPPTPFQKLIADIVSKDDFGCPFVAKWVDTSGTGLGGMGTQYLPVALEIGSLLATAIRDGVFFGIRSLTPVVDPVTCANAMNREFLRVLDVFRGFLQSSGFPVDGEDPNGKPCARFADAIRSVASPLNVNRIIELYSVDRTTVTRSCKRGKLAGAEIVNGEWRVPERSVEAAGWSRRQARPTAIKSWRCVYCHDVKRSKTKPRTCIGGHEHCPEFVPVNPSPARH
jgi:hypothetical protein